jgi:glucose-1-phosphatase
MSENFPRPEFVYFDLGNVLCFFDHAVSAKQMAEVAGSDAATLRRLVYESDLEHRYETGLVTGEQFVAEIAVALRRNLDVPSMLEASSDMFQPNLEILPILTQIRKLGIRIGLLSNTNSAHWNWISRQRFPVVDGWFDPLVLSYQVQVMKPDRRIYEHSAKLANVPSEKIFFTDDRLDNIEGARASGWKAHQFIDVPGLQQIIESWKE